MQKRVEIHRLENGLTLWKVVEIMEMIEVGQHV